MTSKDTAIEWLSQRIDVLIILVALIALVGMVAQISIEDRTSVEETFKNDLVSNAGQMESRVDLTSGANKPLVSYQGVSAVELSGWGSHIIVDGHSSTLWRHSFGFEKLDSDNTIFYTRSNSRYELEQQITTKRGEVIIEYYITPKAGSGVETVTLDLSHYRWYFDNVTATNKTVQFTYSEDGDEFTGQLKVGENGKVVDVNRAEEGPNYFVVSYQITDPPETRKTLLSREVITLDGGSPDIPREE